MKAIIDLWKRLTVTEPSSLLHMHQTERTEYVHARTTCVPYSAFLSFMRIWQNAVNCFNKMRLAHEMVHFVFGCCCCWTRSDLLIGSFRRSSFANRTSHTVIIALHLICGRRLDNNFIDFQWMDEHVFFSLPQMDSHYLCVLGIWCLSICPKPHCLRWCSH